MPPSSSFFALSLDINPGRGLRGRSAELHMLPTPLKKKEGEPPSNRGGGDDSKEEGEHGQLTPGHGQIILSNRVSYTYAVLKLDPKT